MYPVIGACPICGNELQVTRLHCVACETVVEGSFSLGALARLGREQMQFVEVFIKNRGSLKDVGAEIGSSYPTVVKNLNDVLVAMGYAERAKYAEEPTVSPEQRRDILERLARGDISADDAARLLRGKE